MKAMIGLALAAAAASTGMLRADRADEYEDEDVDPFGIYPDPLSLMEYASTRPIFNFPPSPPHRNSGTRAKRRWKRLRAAGRA